MVRNIHCFRIVKRLFSFLHRNVGGVEKLGSVLSVSLKPPEKHILASSIKHRIRLCIFKCFKHVGCESGSSSDSDEENELYNEQEMKEDSLRTFLHPRSTDPIICQLNGCASVQEVFDVVRTNESKMQGHHSSQAVLVLWDIQKIFVKINVQEEFQNTIPDPFLYPQTIIANYIAKINSHDDFHRLLQLLKNGITDMSADAATCTLLYLNKMGIHMNHPIMQSLVAHCESLVEKLENEFPLTALSRFTVAVQSCGGFWLFFVLQKALPLIFRRIDSCETAEDLRLLTICLKNIHQVVSLSTMEKYKCMVEDLVRNGTITAQDKRTIIKAVNFLNLPHWSQHNLNTIRILLHSFKGKVSQLDPRDLVAVHKVFQNQFEPADLLDEIQEYAGQLLSQEGDFSAAVQTSADLLSCVVSFSSPSQKKVFEDHACDHLENKNFSISMVALYKILRYLKTSNVHLCNAYWFKTVQNLEISAEERELNKLLRHCHRYMHFNNNLGGTYHHHIFEKKMIEWLLDKINSGIAGIVPSIFSRLASFLIAYGGTKQDARSKANLGLVVDRLTEMSPQLTERDCLTLSRGYQIAIGMPHWKRISQHTVDQFVKLDALLNNCTMHQLKSEDRSLSNINIIMRAYINRRGALDTELLQSFINRYEHFEGSLSSRLVRDATLNLHMSSCLIPAAVDRLVNYVIEENVNLLGDTVEKVLFLCYNQGYTPANANTFFSVASNIILRDKTRLSGLTLLQAALSLCFYHHLPEELIHFIFTVDFLESLDEEIFRCYSKATYPVRVRNYLMQLNRAVCLDYPEVDVPWFHEKYCKQKEVLEPAQLSQFHLEVRSVLFDVVGGRDLVAADVYSPYGYRIDFQIVLNERGKPINMKHHADKNVTRIAVLLDREDAFCKNVHSLKGLQQMKQRHLEMLGYRIFKLNSTIWNAMYMAEPGAKQNHVKKIIWPEDSMTL